MRTDCPIQEAINRSKAVADQWNVCDPLTSIPAEAAKQIALAALSPTTTTTPGAVPSEGRGQ